MNHIKSEGIWTYQSIFFSVLSGGSYPTFSKWVKKVGSHFWCQIYLSYEGPHTPEECATLIRSIDPITGLSSQHELWSKVEHSKLSQQITVYSNYTESRKTTGIMCISDSWPVGINPESESIISSNFYNSRMPAPWHKLSDAWSVL